MTILLNNHNGDNQPWLEALTRCLPAIPVYIYPDIPDPAEIRYALVWKHPFGDLQHYPNLQAIFSLGAGMEHLLNDPDLPDVPLVSLGDLAMSQDMANYALYWVIHFHRHLEHYRQDQQTRRWERLDTPPVRQFSVLVLGLGRIGRYVSCLIQQAGYHVNAWDFTAKDAGQVASHAGQEALPALLAQSDVVINCLALNIRSRHLINREFLAQLPQGSHIISISRGDVLEESALLDALSTGQIRAAALDVFTTEPLPTPHPFWTHPNVFITPHMAGPTHVDSATEVIAADILRMEQGDMPLLVFERSRGQQV